jgi:hypothetical protein
LGKACVLAQARLKIYTTQTGCFGDMAEEENKKKWLVPVSLVLTISQRHPPFDNLRQFNMLLSEIHRFFVISSKPAYIPGGYRIFKKNQHAHFP